ncbi:OmpA family protein [Celeribacter baekdonensis]|uniref:OmpA family protein n=1 Tax=Celeribacter baekdonensis TaxID=875171 RepID=UPI003A94923D
MRRFILGTAATGVALAGLGMTPMSAQDMQAQIDLATRLGIEMCGSEPPAEAACVTENGQVILADGSEVSLKEALSLFKPPMGSADPLTDEAEPVAEAAPDVAVDPERAPESSVGDEAVADVVHQDVVEEEVLREELAKEMPMQETAPADMGEVAAPEPEPEQMPEAMPEAMTEGMTTSETTPDTSTAETPAPEASPTPRPEAAMDEGAAPEAVATEAPTDVATETGANEDAPMEAASAETESTAVEMTEEDLKVEAEEEATAAAAMEETTPVVAGTEEGAQQEVEVQTETLTEATTRASNEEFAKPDVSAKDGGGLSNLEKFLVGAVGVAVISQVLKGDDKVVESTGDRVVVERDGALRVLKNDDALLRQPGSEVTTERFSDGSTRSTMSRADGTQVITIRAADGRVLRRDRVFADGTRVVLFDDMQEIDAVDVTALPDAPKAGVNYADDEAALRAALAASQAQSEAMTRRFSLNQIRTIRAVRELAPEIALTSVNFETGSAAISPSEAEELAALGRAMKRAVTDNPQEVFLVEGHTDAVGKATRNLVLSDQRAESLALALTEYFGVPPENMVVQGYGERYLKVPTVSAERANRRAAVRIITPLLGQ